jgi:hypothetical protein
MLARFHELTSFAARRVPAPRDVMKDGDVLTAAMILSSVPISVNSEALLAAQARDRSVDVDRQAFAGTDVNDGQAA